MIDIAQFLLGDIVDVQGRHANQTGLYEAEDAVSAFFTFENKVQGSGIWNFGVFENLDRTEIIGDKGRLSFAIFGDAPIRLETASSTREFRIKNPAHIQQPLIQTIVDQLSGSDVCPSTGGTAAGTNRVIDAVLGRSDYRDPLK
jgi:predicted dehydrogenase